jgi:hypothetical protein
MPEFDTNPDTIRVPGAAGALPGASLAAIAAGAARYIDVLLVLVALAPALALGAPAFGLLVGAGGWLAQRALAVLDHRFIVKVAEPGSRLGPNFLDAFGRIWLLAGAIVAAGAIGERSDGLAAALLIFGAYSVAFAVRLTRGRPGAPD